MSRVEDDREAARSAARMQEAKRTEETQRNKKATENAAFSKLMQGAKKEQTVAQQTNLAKSAIAQLLEAAEAGQTDEASHLEHAGENVHQESAFKSKLGVQGQEQKSLQGTHRDGESAVETKLKSDQGTAEAGQGRQSDQTGNTRSAQSRGGDARVSRERIESKKEGRGEGEPATVGGVGGKGDKGELKTDTDKGGGQQGGQSKDDKSGPAANPGFRFNPALMAPVPVAKAKESSGSDRLRKVANELAQKIVERVRVGTNAMGKMEFQIDLRGDVLSGLSVKISAKNGKITAVFSGSDKDVLKMLEEQKETLRVALGTRGLTLEDLKIEAR